MRADEIVIRTTKTGKVTVVVSGISIYCKKRCNLQNAKSKDEKLSCQNVKSAHFPEENFCRQRKLSLKTRKGRLQKKLASKSKNLELLSTNLKLRSKKTRSDCTKMPDLWQLDPILR
jgi:hypothetical protein